MPTTSAGVIILSEDKQRVLLQLREDFRIWGIPAGMVEAGEDSKEAAVREALEETGFDIVIDGFVGEYWRPQLMNGGDRMFVFSGHVVGGSAENRGWESVAVEWFTLEHLPKHMTRFAREYIGDLSASSLPVKKTQIAPIWYITVLGIGITLRNLRNRIMGRA